MSTRICTCCEYYFNSGQECPSCEEWGICQTCLNLGHDLTYRWHRCIQLPVRQDTDDENDENEILSQK